MADDGGPGPGDPVTGGKCSSFTTSTPLPAGTYFALVQQYMEKKIIPGYQLDLTIQ